MILLNVSLLYVAVGVVCADTCPPVLGGQRMMAGVLLCHPPPFSHETGFPTEPVIPLPLRSECLALTPCWDLNSGSHAWVTLTHQATCLPLIDGTKKFILTTANICS